jgi:tRNA 2-thiouridine synthesizing protein B
MLHIINKSPQQTSALDSCLRFAVAEDTLLFIEDGVYATLANTLISARIIQAMNNMNIYALDADVKARGLETRLIAGIHLVDYAGFVDLTCACNCIQSW